MRSREWLLRRGHALDRKRVAGEVSLANGGRVCLTGRMVYVLQVRRAAELDGRVAPDSTVRRQIWAAGQNWGARQGWGAGRSGRRLPGGASYGPDARVAPCLARGRPRLNNRARSAPGARPVPCGPACLPRLRGSEPLSARNLIGHRGTKGSSDESGRRGTSVGASPRRSPKLGSLVFLKHLCLPE